MWGQMFEFLIKKTKKIPEINPAFSNPNKSVRLVVTINHLDFTIVICFFVNTSL